MAKFNAKRKIIVEFKEIIKVEDRIIECNLQYNRITLYFVIRLL